MEEGKVEESVCVGRGGGGGVGGINLIRLHI